MDKNYRISGLKGLKRNAWIICVFGWFAALVFSGCDSCSDCTVVEAVVEPGPPSAPDGVYSVTGDGVVSLYWNPNPEADLAGYKIYWSDDNVDFEFVAEVPNNQTYYDDYDVDNGVTYFYAITAFDTDGEESDLSYETVFDTPRYEGVNLELYDYLGPDSLRSGYNFDSFNSNATQKWDDPSTDIYFGIPNGMRTLFAAGTGVDVQDYGYAEYFEDVCWAPFQGWSMHKKAEMILKHVYIVRLRKGNNYYYDKIWVKGFNADSVVLDWAYQTAPDNPELAPGGGEER